MLLAVGRFSTKMQTSMPASYAKYSVTSRDGTNIGYRRIGHGPGLLLLHGGMKSSQDLLKLGETLSETFTVYVPDRRGRGLSGPAGDSFSVQREVEDVQAIIAETGARNIFGLSSGALVALKAAATTPAIQKAALYEPPFSVDGSVPTSWVPQYSDELATGRVAAAAVTAMKGIGVEPIFNKLPRIVLIPFLALIMKMQSGSSEDHVTIRSLVPTQRFDVHIIEEMSDTLEDYGSLSIPVLLLGGDKSPAFLNHALDRMAATLPHVQRRTFQGLGHDGPENDGRPDLIGRELRRFFDGSSLPQSAESTAS